MTHLDTVLPEALRSFLIITEIDSASVLVVDLFKRKFGHVPPDFPRHFAAFYRDAAGALHLAGYSHMRRLGEVYLSGGSCSNGDALRMMTAEQRALIDHHGGIWFWVLKYKFAKLGAECQAFFGHCGDQRALVVAKQAGFVELQHPHLIAHWHRPLSVEAREQLIAQVHAIGAF
jgi:hypothetical protein